MSKRKQKKSQSEEQAPSPGADLFRRSLLCLVTILIVARPLIPGEDPGLLSDSSNGSNLILTFLWLLAATGWAIWWHRSKDVELRVDLIDTCLLGIVILVFIGTTQASYQLPAWLIGWEWLALLTAFSLIRQLVRTDLERRGLLAVFLANAISLAVFGLYQSTVERSQHEQNIQAQIEQAQERIRNVEKKDRIVSAVGGASTLPLMFLMSGDEAGTLQDRVESLERERVSVLEQKHARATFHHPSSLADYLILVLPSLALAWLAWRGQKSRAIPTLLFLVLVLAALWLTQSRGALLALLLVGSVALAYRYRVVFRRRKMLLIGGAVLVLGIALGSLLLQPEKLDHPRGSIHGRLDFWSVSWTLIEDHTWLGVGAGNFPRHYLQHKPPRASAQITEPHSFIFELWSTNGFFVLLLFLIAIIYFLRRLKHIRELSADAVADPEKPGREFYIAGMIGLLPGYLLKDMRLAPSEALQPGGSRVTLAMLACGRSVVWFLCFALFEKTPWSPRKMALAFGLGSLTLILTLLVSGGVTFSSISHSLWIMIALCLGMISTKKSTSESRKPLRIVLIPVLGGVALAYFMYILVPVSSSQSKAVQAMKAARYYREVIEKDSELLKRLVFLYKNVAQPLSRAVYDESQQSRKLRNANRGFQLSRTYREVWLMSLAAEHENLDRKHYLFGALTSALGARSLDKRNVAIHRLEAEILLLASQWDTNDNLDQLLSEALKNVRFLQEALRRNPKNKQLEMRLEKEQGTARELSKVILLKRRQSADRIRQGIKLLYKARELDPTNPQILFQLWDALRAHGDKASATQIAEEAIKLDPKVPRSRKLTYRQSQQVKQWLKGS